MPTSPHWAPTNSPELFEKTGAFCRVDVGIDPYEPPGKFQKNCRGGRGFPSFGSYEFSVDFRKNRIFCGRTEASVPTNFFDTLCKNASARSAILLARRVLFCARQPVPRTGGRKKFQNLLDRWRAPCYNYTNLPSRWYKYQKAGMLHDKASFPRRPVRAMSPLAGNEGSEKNNLKFEYLS